MPLSPHDDTCPYLYLYLRLRFHTSLTTPLKMVHEPLQRLGQQLSE